MLQRMSVSGLGPHLEFEAEFNPSGRTLVSGPSEAGKTCLMEAITFCLWGRTHGGKFRPEAINDRSTKAVVEIMLDSGRVIRRSITRTKSQQRSITMGEDTQTYTSETKFAAALGDLGQDVDALQVVIVPFEWVKMVEGNARTFRDLLTRILPDANVAAEVERLMADKEMRLEPGDADLSEKEVMKRRSAARKERDEAMGRLQSAQERLDGLLMTRPVGGEAPADPQLIEAINQWAAYDRQVGGGPARAAAEEALRLWEERNAALGEEPPWDPAFDSAEQRFQQAQWNVNQTTQAYQQAYGQQQAALAQVQQFEGTDPSVCPTCTRPGWEAGVQYLAQLNQWKEQVQAAFEQTTAHWQAATAELNAATEAVTASREAAMRRRAWQDARRTLGSRPTLPEVSPGAPERPTLPRPSPEAAAAATTNLQESAAQQGAFQQWKANHDAAADAADRETRRHGEAAAEYDRLSALLEAVRAAPSVVASRQALALGDLGPVTLVFGDNPAVAVHIDDRPWWLASRGRQVVADMYLRAAIRRVLEKEWLPIIVDNVQDVAGQPLPDVGGPVVLLQTTESKEISVRRR